MLQSPTSREWSLKRTLNIVLLLVIISASTSAWAGTILDLPIKGGGVFAYAAGERYPRFYGRGIRVGDLSYGGNILPILKGRLAFSSGTFLGSGGDSWSWGAGGSIFVRGCADLDHNGSCGGGDFKGTLITGTFISAELIIKDGKQFLEAQIANQINPELAALLGLSNTTYHGEIELLLANMGNHRWWVRGTTEGGFLRDGGAVPEPSSMWLLASSLVCLGAATFSRVLLAKF